MKLRWAPALHRVLAALLLVLLTVGCAAGGARVPGNTAVGSIPTAPAAVEPDTPVADDGVLSASQLYVVYKLILERFVDRVDHTQLIETAAKSLRESLLSSQALPLETALIDLLPAGSEDPDQAWDALGNAYDALVQKYPDWAARERPDHRMLSRLMESLADQHSAFVPREEARRLRETGYSGIGVRLAQPDGSQAPRIAEVFPGTPAERHGLKVGDRIRAVDGQPIAGEPLSRIVELIRGPEGSTVRLEIERPGQADRFTVAIARQAVQIPLVTGNTFGAVGYLRILAFSEPVPQIATALVSEMKRQGARGWVLDLRGNSGGQLGAVQAVAGLFIDDGTIGIEINRSRERQLLGTRGPTLVPDDPLVILIDGETTSGAEILAAALRERRQATLIGERTAGNVAVAEEFGLPDGSLIRLTVRRFLSPSGSQLDRVGVSPDVPVALTDADLAANHDPQLDQALATLQHQLR